MLGKHIHFYKSCFKEVIIILGHLLLKRPLFMELNNNNSNDDNQSDLKQKTNLLCSRLLGFPEQSEEAQISVHRITEMWEICCKLDFMLGTVGFMSGCLLREMQITQKVCKPAAVGSRANFQRLFNVFIMLTES